MEWITEIADTLFMGFGSAEELERIARTKKYLFMGGGAFIGLISGVLVRDFLPDKYGPYVLIGSVTTGALLGVVAANSFLHYDDLTGTGKHKDDANVYGAYNADGTPKGGAYTPFEKKLLKDMYNREAGSLSGPDSCIKYDPSNTRLLNQNSIDVEMSECDKSIWQRVKKNVDLQWGSASNVGQLAGMLSQSRAPWVAKAFYETLNPEDKVDKGGSGIADGSWMQRHDLIQRYHDRYSQLVAKDPYVRLYCNKPTEDGSGDSWSMTGAGVFAPCYAKSNLEPCTLVFGKSGIHCNTQVESYYDLASDSSDWKTGLN